MHEMHRVKPTVVSRKGNAPQDRRISVCSKCKYGIFTFHAYEWSNLGFIHIDCKDKEFTKQSTSTD